MGCGGVAAGAAQKVRESFLVVRRSACPLVAKLRLGTQVGKLCFPADG